MVHERAEPIFTGLQLNLRQFALVDILHDASGTDGLAEWVFFDLTRGTHPTYQPVGIHDTIFYVVFRLKFAVRFKGICYFLPVIRVNSPNEIIPGGLLKVWEP